MPTLEYLQLHQDVPYKSGDLGNKTLNPSAPNGTISAPAVSSPTKNIILHQIFMSILFFHIYLQNLKNINVINIT